MSYRHRPVNCRLQHYPVEDALSEWLEGQIKEGNADDLIWDRLNDMDAPEIMRTFGSFVEFVVENGDADDAVKARARELGWSQE